VGDTVGQNPGFARAGAGQDEYWALGREHCVALDGIEIVEVQHRFRITLQHSRMRRLIRGAC
jgi:hypothetical protein